MYLSKNVIDLEKGSYTFSDYFKMNITSENLAKVYGYNFSMDSIAFNQDELGYNLAYFIESFSNNINAVKKKINLLVN
jgi:hypothetical protein